MNLYSIKDTKAEIHQAPWVAKTHVHAMRSFQGEINRADPQNALYNHPMDFQLVHIGTFNEETGELALTKPTVILTGERAAGLETRADMKLQASR